MTRRYYAPTLPPAGGIVNLSAEEAGHAIRVMRVQVGDEIELFDGRGSQSRAEVVSLTRKDCVLQSDASVIVPRMPARVLELAVALPKPDRAKEMVERLTELGVAKLTPIIAERTQRGPSDSVIGKLERVVIEDCKQSGRNRLMEIGPVISSQDFLGRSHEGRCVIAHQGEGALSLRDLDGEAKLVAAVGPEGGWTDDEVALAEAHAFERVSLGERIYRIETAAVVIGS